MRQIASVHKTTGGFVSFFFRVTQFRYLVKQNLYGIYMEFGDNLVTLVFLNDRKRRKTRSREVDVLCKNYGEWFYTVRLSFTEWMN